MRHTIHVRNEGIGVADDFSTFLRGGCLGPGWKYMESLIIYNSNQVSEMLFNALSVIEVSFVVVVFG